MQFISLIKSGNNCTPAIERKDRGNLEEEFLIGERRRRLAKVFQPTQIAFAGEWKEEIYSLIKVYSRAFRTSSLFISLWRRQNGTELANAPLSEHQQSLCGGWWWWCRDSICEYIYYVNNHQDTYTVHNVSVHDKLMIMSDHLDGWPRREFLFLRP